MEHCNTFEYDLKIGNLFENKLENILNNAKLEVKTDFKALRTGNIFLEYESRGKKSGILKSKADFYVFIFSMQYIIMIEKETLINIAREVYRVDGFVRGGDNKTSKGVLIPIRKIQNYVKAVNKKGVTFDK